MPCPYKIFLTELLMKKLFSIIFLTGLICSRFLFADEMDDAWADRHSKEKAKHLMETGEKLIKEKPDSYDFHWKFSRACWFYGSFFLSSNEDKKAAFGNGKEAGIRAISLNPAGVEGYFWYAVNLGEWGQANGIMNSLEQVKPMKKALEKSVVINPNYDNGGGYRVLGRLYFKAPSVISVGDNKKSIEYLKKALAKDTTHKLTILFLAETLMDEGEYKEALSYLEQAANAPIVSHRETEEKSWLRDIKKNIEKCREKLK
jgi:tetratricopeptide (TPR) repeat protein